ncbi:uncharacterized protein LOC133736682 [Rosa rugosa]|uniref:uncharacterized protein LOC133736682 n=1 Tax=Rosa rugosa TaxID=74645 RepID=UPI002B40FAB0|nr:uncharacterized protein LOC133736682 [Rosa rugosa]
MATDDFSFPTVHKSSSTSNIHFPPLWRPSPAAACTGDEEDHAALITSPVENIEGVDDDQIIVSSDVRDQEEKMDMLWEDFNEELYPVRSTSDYSYASGEMLQLGCVGLGAFNLSKSNAARNSSTITNPGVVVIVKLLKKLFFLHNSHHHNLNKPANR